MGRGWGGVGRQGKGGPSSGEPAQLGRSSMPGRWGRGRRRTVVGCVGWGRGRKAGRRGWGGKVREGHNTVRKGGVMGWQG